MLELLGTVVPEGGLVFAEVERVPEPERVLCAELRLLAEAAPDARRLPPAIRTRRCSSLERLAAKGCHGELDTELLDAGLSCEQTGCDLTDGGEHGDAAIVQLTGAHLGGVVVEPRKGIAEIARLLALVLHEDGRLQGGDDSKDRNAADHAIADENGADVLGHALHARYLHHALCQHAQGAHHREPAMLELLGTVVPEGGLVFAEVERVPEPERVLCAELRLLAEAAPDARRLPPAIRTRRCSSLERLAAKGCHGELSLVESGHLHRLLALN